MTGPVKGLEDIWRKGKMTSRDRWPREKDMPVGFHPWEQGEFGVGQRETTLLDKTLQLTKSFDWRLNISLQDLTKCITV